MANVRAYIRTQNKTNQAVRIRFNLGDKNTNLSYLSDLYINPLYWDPKKQAYTNTKSVNNTDKIYLDTQVQIIKSVMMQIYTSKRGLGDLTSEILTQLVNKELVPTGQVQIEDKQLDPPREKPKAKKLTEFKIDTAFIRAIDFCVKHN